MQPDINLLLGPLGLTVGLIYLVWLLLTERVVPKSRLNASLERESELKNSVREAIDLAKSSNEAVERMADAVEARNALEAERVRIESVRQGRSRSRPPVSK